MKKRSKFGVFLGFKVKIGKKIDSKFYFYFFCVFRMRECVSKEMVLFLSSTYY
jgi:hypothetical protein